MCEKVSKISWSLVSLRGEAEAIQNLDSNNIVDCHDLPNGKSRNDKKTFKYIDLSSVSRDFHKIIDFQIISKGNAPSRAQQIIKTNDVLFATTRPTLHRFCIIDTEFNEQICSTGFCVLRAKQDMVLSKWLMYCISTQKCLDFVETNQEGASYPSISDNKFKQFKIPIPPLEIQEKIVSILDKFESLANDLSQGLPAEIKARKKQYEYYREKLLSF